MTVPLEILEVYKKSQDSAEHHNTMIWQVGLVGSGIFFFLLKFTFFDISGKTFFFLDNPSLQSIMISVNLFAIIYFAYLVEGANKKKELKYGICKRIEKKYNFLYQQHSNIDLNWGIILFRFSIISVFLSILMAYIIFIDGQPGSILSNPPVVLLSIFLVVFFYSIFIIFYSKVFLKNRKI